MVYRMVRTKDKRVVRNKFGISHKFALFCAKCSF
jgi:hypothetical protein